LVDGLKSRPAGRELATATRAAAKAGLYARVGSSKATPKRLPLPDEAADAALCECALTVTRKACGRDRLLARLLLAREPAEVTPRLS
jgi:hypothetical protein